MKPPDAVRQLAANLPANIRFLASQIARKPAAFTPEWAGTVEDAFSLYTRTNTMNLVLSVNDLLAHLDWPFPGYFDLRRGLKDRRSDGIVSGFRSKFHLGRKSRTLFAAIGSGVALDEPKLRTDFDKLIVGFFQWNSMSVFKYWSEHSLLAAKRPIIGDLKQCYSRRLWAACIPTVLPLLDLVMRDYFGTNNLRITVQSLRQAFKTACILPKDLKPGYAVWNGSRDPAAGNALTPSVDEDLRLPGVYLSSFVEFAQSYYEWYSVTSSAPLSPLNRHAVMHCASEYWSEVNTVKIFTFFDLVLRLEKPLRILVHGPTSQAATGLKSSTPAGAE
jgi:hypothetical protein